MNYTPNIRKSSQTFVSVLQKAKDWFVSLSKTEQQNLDKIFTDLIQPTGILQLIIFPAETFLFVALC